MSGLVPSGEDAAAIAAADGAQAPAARPTPPGGVVGIIGGGQLGKMLCLAAARLGFMTHVYAPPGDAPAAAVATQTTRGSADYARDMTRFASECDVVTFEFENVPLAAIEAAAAEAPVRPGRRALEIAQDRLLEKRFARTIGLRTTEFDAIDDADGLAAALRGAEGPTILKTRRLGYDGRGQVALPTSAADRAAAAWDAIGGAAAILERRVPFVREISVIAARGVDGGMRVYDPAENRHEDGILRESRVPADISEETAEAAQAIAGRLMDALGYVGVMGVELFETADGALLLNEFAPRVHNTGHWTAEACLTSQFEQHIRAVCGWPLAGSERHSDAEMRNLLGDDVLEWPAMAAEAGVALHIYGKSEPRPGRKMGHVTRISPRATTPWSRAEPPRRAQDAQDLQNLQNLKDAEEPPALPAPPPAPVKTVIPPPPRRVLAPPRRQAAFKREPGSDGTET